MVRLPLAVLVAQLPPFGTRYRRPGEGTLSAYTYSVYLILKRDHLPEPGQHDHSFGCGLTRSACAGGRGVFPLREGYDRTEFNRQA